MISKKQKDRFRKLGVNGEMLSEPWLNLWIRPDEETEDRADDLYAAIKTVEQDLEKACQQRLNKLLDRKIALVKEQIQENDRPTKLT